MKQPPYSFNEARKLCQDAQYLAGNIYSRDYEAVIDAIVVAPYEQVSKNRFLMLYLMLDDAEMALSGDYAGNLFDVLVMTGSLGDGGMQHQSLHIWLEVNGEGCPPGSAVPCEDRAELASV